MSPRASDGTSRGERAWVREQLRAGQRQSDLIVVLDPDGVAHPLDLESFGGEVVMVAGWLELRRSYEERGRDRPHDGAPLVLHVTDGFRIATDLPWDIEQRADVVRLRWPMDGVLRDLLRAIPDDRSDAVLRGGQEAGLSGALAAGFGIVLPNDAAGELDSVVRLLLDPDVAPAVWDAASLLMREPLSRSVAEHVGDAALLQDGWRDWVAGATASPDASIFAVAGPSLAGLFATGLLRPEPTARHDLPHWMSIGVAAARPVDLIEVLLANMPEPWPPRELSEWFAAAAWWGELRAAVALGAPVPDSLATAAATRWQELDTAFGPWLRANLGTNMLATTARPRTVNKVVGFLARRLRDCAERVLLVVLDGMGFAQWSILRLTAGIEVIEANACLAMVPTLTSISRQALFAGEPASGFADTLLSTGREDRQWADVWATEGIARGAVRYERVDGRDAAEVPSFHGEQVFGLVVSAVDRIVHGSKVLGDAQVGGDVRLWASHGFVASLLKSATHAGFEIWVTSDHGNLEARSGDAAREGMAVEQAGTRVRLYPNTVLRDSARTAGIAWDPPGFPEDRASPLFARADYGFHSCGRKVSHGGLSLDEVIVPFARVRA